MNSVWNILKDNRNSGGEQVIGMWIWNFRKEFKLEDMRVTSIEMVHEAVGPQLSLTSDSFHNCALVVYVECTTLRICGCYENMSYGSQL